MMLYLIYPYRNRDVIRVKRSLESLKKQTNQNFRVLFVDYGSKPEIASSIKTIVESYAFSNYNYIHSQYQPWNKSRALNSIIRTLNDGYCFVADVDMIFRSDFIETAIQLQKPNSAVYFKVGFLSDKETQLDKNFNDYELKFESTAGATGLTMCPTNILKKVRGFDEFYHFWGSEDTDVHVRLKNAGYKVQFYEDGILMLHQWHKTYRLKETKELSRELQMSHIVRLNFQHLQTAIKEKKTIVNDISWGQIITKQQEKQCLEALKHSRHIPNVKEAIDHFVFVELPHLKSGTHAFKFIEDQTNKTLKYKAKKVLKKRVDTYYSLKEVNDIVLLYIIGSYRNHPYIFKVSKDTSNIEFSIIIA
jgi:GT2 family glycosyltransferase